MQPLLDAIIEYLPSPLDKLPVKAVNVRGAEVSRPASDETPFTALAFKVVSDPYVGRLVYIRVYSGRLKVGSAVLNSVKQRRERAGKLLQMYANRREELAAVEAGAVFDALKPRTTAEPKGESFVVSGSKCFVPLGDRASHFLVLARNGEWLDAFIVAREAEGLSISEPELNLGLRGLVTVSLDLERVEVPAADRLGGAEGCDVRNLLANSRAALSAVMVGLSRGVLEECIPYAKDRVAFDEAIAKKQSIAFRMSDMHIETECMRWLTWKAASFVEQGLDAVRPARLARSYAAEKCLWIADNGIQIFGGHGFIREQPLEMWFRNARTLGVLEGTIGV